MTDDDLQRRLDALGRSDTPMVDPAFADGLESDLRAMAAAPQRATPLAWLLRPSVVIAALAILAGFAFFVSRSEPAGLEFAAADDTSVSIPGAPDLASGAAGQALPEGARIMVGPDGSATVGGLILDPGTVAIVVNGVIEVVELPADISPPTSTTTTSVAETTTTTTAERDTTTTVSPTATADAADDRTSTTETTVDEETTPTTVASDRSTTATTTEAPTTTTSTTTTTVPSTTSEAPATTAPAEAAPPTIELTINEGPLGRTFLEWTVTGDTSEIAGWVVRRGRGDDSVPIAVIRRPEARRQRVDVPDRDVAWTVVARNADGEVIARSNLVRSN